MPTPRLLIPYLSTSQAQKEVTHNDALNVLDGWVQASVVSRTLATPPASPTEGVLYLVGASPTGAWAGQANELAQYLSGAWTFRDPFEGASVWVQDESTRYTYIGGAWTASGAVIVRGTKSVTANGALVASDSGKVILLNPTANIDLKLPRASAISAGWSTSLKRINATGTVTARGSDNRLIQSNVFSNVAWTKSNTVIGATAVTDPFGGATAFEIQENTTNASHDCSQSYTKPAGIVTVVGSVYLKADERTFGIIMIDDGTGTNRVQLRANLSTGAVDFSNAVGTFAVAATSVTNAGNGWYRLILTATVPTASGTVRLAIRLYDGTTVTYAGTTGSGFFAYGASLQEGAADGGYIDTTTAAFRDTIDGAVDYTLTAQWKAAVLIWTGSQWVIESQM